MRKTASSWSVILSIALGRVSPAETLSLIALGRVSPAETLSLSSRSWSFPQIVSFSELFLLAV